LGTSKSFNLFM